MKTLFLLLTTAVAVLYFLPDTCRSSAVKIASTTAEVLTEEESPAKRILSQQREVFAQIIQGFEEESSGLRNVLEEGKESLLSFRENIQQARNQDAEFNAVYTRWEAVEKKTRTLKEEFKKLTDGAADFYATAINHAETIHDKILREDSLQYIGQSRASYLLKLKETQGAIQQVDAMKTAVDDTMKALEIRFAVDTVDQRLTEMFVRIDQMVADVLLALKELEAESQLVLGQFGGEQR